MYPGSRWVLLVLGAILLVGAAIASPIENACQVDPGRIDQPGQTPTARLQTEGRNQAAGDYDGYVRLYVVEPVSRWKDQTNHAFHHGFLGLALDTAVSLHYLDTLRISRTWDGNLSGFGNITEGNIEFEATVANGEGNFGYSDPPGGGLFVGHYVDACAAAKPGETDSNVVKTGYTHTVFVEDGSTTWCPYCPSINTILYNLYQSGNFNFHYMEVISDSCNIQPPVCPIYFAGEYMYDFYNLYYLPTCYFDGGYQVAIGGTSDPGFISQPIINSGARSVNGPPELPTLPVGPSSGLPIKSYTYTTSATDQDPSVSLKVSTTWLGSATVKADVEVIIGYQPSDQIKYLWDWGDGQTSGWLGPFASGAVATGSHAWSQIGSYSIKVKAKDEHNAETDWSPVTSIEIGAPGDANHDAAVNVGDAVYIINYVFKSGPAPQPQASGDANCDSAVNVGDAVSIINYVFKGGKNPGC